MNPGTENTFARCAGWLADETGLAFATMAAGQVGADRVGSTRSFETFVDIHASGTRWLETVAAKALAVQAFGIVDAIEIAFTVGRHVHLRKKRRTELILFRSANRHERETLGIRFFQTIKRKK